MILRSIKCVKWWWGRSREIEKLKGRVEDEGGQGEMGRGQFFQSIGKIGGSDGESNPRPQP